MPKKGASGALAKGSKVSGVIRAAQEKKKEELMKEHKVLIGSILRRLEPVFNSDAEPNSADTSFRNHFFTDFSESEREVLVFRFLAGNNYSEEKAVAALLATAEFRKTQNIDRMALFPSLIAIRGYNERTLCAVLNLPYLSPDEVSASTAAGHSAGSAFNLPKYTITTTTTTTGAVSGDEGVLRTDQSGNDFGYYHTEYDALYREDSSEPAAAQDGKASAGEKQGPDSADSDGNSPGFLSRLLHRHSKPSHSAGATKSEEVHSSASSSELPSEYLGQRQRSCSSASSSFASSVSGWRESDKLAITTSYGADHASRIEQPQHHNYLNFHSILKPIIDHVTASLPICAHYWDKDGRPVLYVRLGALNSKQLFDTLTDYAPVGTSPKAVLVLFYVYVQEIIAQLLRFTNLKRVKDNEIRQAFAESTQGSATKRILPIKSSVHDILLVVDCKRIKVNDFLYKPLMALIKSLVHITSRYYPCLLHRMHIVNCHSAVNMIYMYLRNAMSEGTRRRVCISSPEESLASLKENVDIEYIPRELGGRCKCAQGCLPLPSVEASLNCPSEQSDADSLHSESTSVYGQGAGKRSLYLPNNCVSNVESFTIKGRGKKQMNLSMEKGQDVIWDFTVKHKKQIEFSATFFGADETSHFVLLRNECIVQNDAFHYVCPSMGTLVLKWRNSQSIFKSRKVRVKIFYVSKTDEKSAVRSPTTPTTSPL